MPKRPYIIVLGNEKGGTGKSTTAMHLIVSLLREGFSVGAIDVDARQGTLTRYLENRKRTASEKKYSSDVLPLPQFEALHVSDNKDQEKSQKEDQKNLEDVLERFKNNDFIIMDTPGHNLYLARLAHSYADTLITPLNDSFIDLDVIAQVMPETLEITKPSLYAEWVWEQKKNRAIRDRSSIDWIVLRNRLTNIYAKNKENMEQVLNALSKRIGFRLISGFGERVIFREFFLSGLTLLDLKETGQNLSISHVTARQELRALMKAINLPSLHQRLGQVV
ncbi:MAG: AAA family ATPase [Proteobacteria bacterium]|nr:AAA family ATPase [Pseudomonadota bacterium]